MPDVIRLLNKVLLRRPKGFGTKSDIGVSRIYPLAENYIYFYHTDSLILLPNWPEQIRDGQNANFSPTTILGRSAPIQAYGSGGPRTMSFALLFHREMLKQTNSANVFFNAPQGFEDDYVDYMVNMLYGSVIPNYSSSAKLVDPPLVALRFENQTYIKGIVTNFSANYNGAILRDGKFSMITIDITVTEINPYDAITAMGVGSFRSDGEILMSTELNKSTYNIGKSINSGGMGHDVLRSNGNSTLGSRGGSFVSADGKQHGSWAKLD